MLGPQDLLVHLDQLFFTHGQCLSFDRHAVKQEGAVLADAPAGNLNQWLFLGAVISVPDSLPGLVHYVRLQLRGLGDELDRVENDVITNKITCPFQDLDKGIDVTAFARTRSISVCGGQHPGRTLSLELWLGGLENDHMSIKDNTL